MSDADVRPSYSHFGGPEIAMMERFTGGQAAESLLKLSGVLDAVGRARTDKPVEVLENAAGAGVLTHVLMNNVKGEEGKVRVVLGDVEQKMVGLAKERKELEGWQNVEVRQMDGMNVPLDDSSFDFTFIHFGLQVFPDAAKGISECHRLLRPSGVIGYTVWHEPGFLPLLLAADPSFRVPPSMSTPFADPSAVSTALAEAGFTNVRTDPIAVPAKFESVEAFFESMKMAMGGLFSDEERNERIGKLIVDEHGVGPFTLWWKGQSVVATKNEA